MKVKIAIIVMNLLGTLSQAAKTLKVPRIYNALITSDEMLLPSQAYPALSPVFQGIQYPLPAYYATNIYPPVLANQIPMTSYMSGNDKMLTYSSKQDINYNEEEPRERAPSSINRNTEFQFDSGNPAMHMFSNHRALFTPNLNEVFTDYMIPNSNMKNKPNLRKQQMPYSHTDEDNEQVVNVMNYENNKKVYSASSPVSADPPSEHSPYNYNFSSIGKSKPSKSSADNFYHQNSLYSTEGYRYGEPNVKSASAERGYEEQDQAPEVNPYPAGNIDAIKNNKPKDPSIVDVPPPPLPISKPKAGHKKPEEYPPAPLGFV